MDLGFFIGEIARHSEGDSASATVEKFESSEIHA